MVIFGVAVTADTFGTVVVLEQLPVLRLLLPSYEVIGPVPVG